MRINTRNFKLNHPFRRISTGRKVCLFLDLLLQIKLQRLKKKENLTTFKYMINTDIWIIFQFQIFRIFFDLIMLRLSLFFCCLSSLFCFYFWNFTVLFLPHSDRGTTMKIKLLKLLPDRNTTMKQGCFSFLFYLCDTVFTT